MPARSRRTAKCGRKRGATAALPVCTARAPRAAPVRGRGKVLGPTAATLMSDVGAWTRSDARLAFIRHDGSVAAAARVAAVGCVALVAMAPFETLQPVLALPGQALSSVEVVLAT